MSNEYKDEMKMLGLVKCLDYAECARETTADLGAEKIPLLSITDRFSLIHHIKKVICTEFEPPDDNPFENIDEKKAKNAINALSLLNATLKLSDDYQDFVLMVTKKAADELSANTRFIKDILRWKDLTTDNRLSLCQEFHDTVIGFAQQAFKGMQTHDPLAQATTPVNVLDFTQDINTLLGYVYIGVERENNNPTIVYDDIKLNVGCEQFKTDAAKTMGTVAHETAHIIEGVFASIYGHHEPFIPEIFRNDAKLLFNMHALDAYIGSRIYSAYIEQANERLASQAGTVAKEIITDAMMDALKPDLPFIPPYR